MEKDKIKLDKKTIMMVAFAVLLVIAVGYIVVDKWQEKKQAEQMGIFQQGAQYGYEQAIVQVIQQAVTCQEVPLRIGNDTIGIVAVDCLGGAQ